MRGGGKGSDALVAEYNLHMEPPPPPGRQGWGWGEWGGVKEPDQYQHFHDKRAEYS